MKTTGQILRENRERKGISINEVAIATKINVKSITAMESGDTENLPPKTFLRGFVKAYATYLELDVDSVMNTFFEEMGSTKPKPPEAIPTSPRGNSAEAERAINPKSSLLAKIGAVAGIIVLAVLIFVVKNKMDNYEKESVPGTPPAGIEALPGTSPGASASPGASSSPSASASPGATPEGTPGASPSATPSAASAVVAAPTATASATPTPTAAPTATATAKPTPSPTPEPTAKPNPSATPKPTSTPKPTPTATPAPTPKATPEATPAAAAAATAEASPSPTPKPAKANEILIEALNDVTITATIDGEKKSITLAAGAVQNIRAKKVVLQLSDAGAVNLTVNGADKGVPGDLGKPKKVTIP